MKKLILYFAFFLFFSACTEKQQQLIPLESRELVSFEEIFQQTMIFSQNLTNKNFLGVLLDIDSQVIQKYTNNTIAIKDICLSMVRCERVLFLFIKHNESSETKALYRLLAVKRKDQKDCVWLEKYSKVSKATPDDYLQRALSLVEKCHF